MNTNWELVLIKMNKVLKEEVTSLGDALVIKEAIEKAIKEVRGY